LPPESDHAGETAEACPATGNAPAEGRIAIIWGAEAKEAPKPGPPSRHLLDVVRTINWKNPSHRQKIKNYIAAKLVGRWKDGTSLVRHPLMPGGEQRPAEVPDNEFLLGKEDPAGFSCPFGAHIRRANPRDTRFPGKAEEVATTNRHRILRVGRAYSDSTNQRARGLLFMCLNADIERQFEFIQKTWLLNPNVHGLQSEVDPILGQGTRRLTIPTPTGSVHLTIDRQFVQVKGGGYFFLPGRAVLRFLAGD
jgi:deferrochelatase/peroxidase EfeB